MFLLVVFIIYCYDFWLFFMHSIWKIGTSAVQYSTVFCLHIQKLKIADCYWQFDFCGFFLIYSIMNILVLVITTGSFTVVYAVVRHLYQLDAPKGVLRVLFGKRIFTFTSFLRCWYICTVQRTKNFICYNLWTRYYAAYFTIIQHIKTWQPPNIFEQHTK